METIDKVVAALGAADIDARLEEQLVDGILYAFQEQVGWGGLSRPGLSRGLLRSTTAALPADAVAGVSGSLVIDSVALPF